MSKIEDQVEELTEQFSNFKPLSIEVLKQAPWNYKTSDDVLQSKLAANIKRSGQVENILVRPLGDGSYEVVNGNHRLLALQHLGYKKVFCYDLGPISEAQAKRIAIETNETKFDSDPLQLARLVNEISTEFQDFSTTAPFKQEELDNFQNLMNFDWDAAEKKPDGKPEGEKELTDGPEGNEIGNKTETLLSVGGEDFRVIKLELSTAAAERFTAQVQRLQTIVGKAADAPINVICELLEKKTDEELDLESGSGPKKSAKKSRKK